MKRAAFLATGLAFALPLPGHAIGNRLALDCVPHAPAAGADEADVAGPQAFALALKRGGAIEVAVPGGFVPGVSASKAGPFAWTVGTTLNTLTLKGRTADGGTLVLWHRLDQAQTQVPPTGTLTKLICELS